MSRNFADGHSWVLGNVFENDGTTAVRMRLDDGRIWRRHFYHVTHSQVVEELEGQDSQQSQTHWLLQMEAVQHQSKAKTLNKHKIKKKCHY